MNVHLVNITDQYVNLKLPFHVSKNAPYKATFGHIKRNFKNLLCLLSTVNHIEANHNLLQTVKNNKTMQSQLKNG